SAVPLGGVILITSRAEAPDPAGGGLDRPELTDAWSQRLREAVALGRDASDRFQSVTRWRDEATPLGPASAVMPQPPGKAIRRFAAPGWPAQGTSIRLADAQAPAI